MKAGEEPWVLFIPDFGLVKVKGRDFRLETNPRKMSQWVAEPFAQAVLANLLPEDPVKRMLVVNGQVLLQSQGMRQQRALDAFRALFDSYKTSMSDREKEVLYEL